MEIIYDWKTMQESGMIRKLKVGVLDLFFKKHLLKHKMTKSEKLQVINARLSMQLLKATKHTTEESIKNLAHMMRTLTGILDVAMRKLTLLLTK